MLPTYTALYHQRFRYDEIVIVMKYYELLQYKEYFEWASENSSQVSTNFYTDKEMCSDVHLYVTFWYNQGMFVITNAERNNGSLTRIVTPKNKTTATIVWDETFLKAVTTKDVMPYSLIEVYVRFGET
jgi:hypothetical protein